jgi:four helix bundle protein
MKAFRDLLVWQKSHQLTLAVYGASRSFAREELYGLTSQVRRAAASIPANIAEGCGRGSDNELRRFLEIAMGSASELEYHLLLVHDLDMLNPEAYQQLNEQTCEVKRMLAAFIVKIKRERNEQSAFSDQQSGKSTDH